MSETETVTPEPQEGDAEALSETTEQAPSKKSDPFARIKAAKEKAQLEAEELRNRLKEIEDEKLAEQGKYKELAEERAKELEATKKLSDTLLAEKVERDALDQAQVNQMLEAIPEEHRPDVEGLPISKQKQLVEQFAKAFNVKTPSPGVGNPMRPSQPTIKSAKELADEALKNGEFSLDEMIVK